MGGDGRQHRLAVGAGPSEPNPAVRGARHSRALPRSQLQRRHPSGPAAVRPDLPLRPRTLVLLPQRRAGVSAAAALRSPQLLDRRGARSGPRAPRLDQSLPRQPSRTRRKAFPPLDPLAASRPRAPAGRKGVLLARPRASRGARPHHGGHLRAHRALRSRRDSPGRLFLPLPLLQRRRRFSRRGQLEGIPRFRGAPFPGRTGAAATSTTSSATSTWRSNSGVGKSWSESAPSASGGQGIRPV